MRKIFLGTLVAILAISLLLGSCSTSSSTTTSSPPPTSSTSTTSTPTTQPPTQTSTTTKPPTTTSSTPTGKAPYGTVNIAVADFGGNESLDPINVESTFGWMFYDALLRWDENGNICYALYLTF